MRHLFKLFASFLLISLVTGCASSEIYIAPAAEPGTDYSSSQNPSQRVFTLKNGLTLVIKESMREAPVSMQVWVQGGSVTDPAGKVRAASLEDLQRAPGVSAAVAQAVYDFYHPRG